MKAEAGRLLLLHTFSTLIFDAETPMRILTVLRVHEGSLKTALGCTRHWDTGRKCPFSIRTRRPTTANQGDGSGKLTMADRCPRQYPPLGAAVWLACSSGMGPQLGLGSLWAQSTRSHLQVDCRKQQGHQQHGSLREQPCAAATLGRLVYGARSIEVKPGCPRLLRHGARSDALINDFGCNLCTCESKHGPAEAHYCNQLHAPAPQHVR